MTKRHISIIGTCVSRELFNNPLMSESFEIDEYFFQRCVWDMTSEPIGVLHTELERVNAESFSVRMLERSMNKDALDVLAKAGSEYLMIDLYNMRAPIVKVMLGERACYVQNTSETDVKALKAAQTLPYFKDLKLETVDATELDERIMQGLSEFAARIKEIFDERKIIINYPRHAQLYSIDGTVKPYPENMQKIHSAHDFVTDKWSDCLRRLLPNAVVLEPPTGTVALYGFFDNIDAVPFPPAIHHSRVDMLRRALYTLSSLGIECEKTYEQCLEQTLVSEMARFVKTNYELSRMKKEMLTLNNYFSKLKRKEDFIIVLTAKDDCANNLKYFRSKGDLPLKFRIGFRDSYIAIIDMKRGFVYENTSLEAQTYSYRIGENLLFAESAGMGKGNISRVQINGGDNLSRNQRGLNILVLNSETLEVVDRANCDSFGDKELKVSSDYYNRVNSQIK